MNSEKNKLTVLEAYTRDVGRGIARIDNETMEKLGLSKGNIMEIKGKRRTVARCLSPLTGSQLVVERMQLEQARKQMHKTHFEEKNNSKTGFDWTGRDPESYKVPFGSIRIDGLTRNNAGIAIGDAVLVKKIQSTIAEKVLVAPLESIPPIDERYLADALESIPMTKGDNVMIPYFGGRLTFQVVDTEPPDDIVIDQKTIFTIMNKNTNSVHIMSSFGYSINHIDSEKLTKLKTDVEQCEKELSAKQDEIKNVTRKMLKENHKMEDIHKFLNSNRNESLISTFQKLLNMYRQYVTELEAATSRK